MSKTGKWVLELTEDANNMTREEFIKKHGEFCVDVWDSEKEMNDLLIKTNKTTNINLVCQI